MTEIILHFVHHQENLDLHGCLSDFTMHLLHFSESCMMYRGDKKSMPHPILMIFWYNSLTWEEHLAHIKAVLEALRQSGLTAKASNRGALAN